MDQNTCRSGPACFGALGAEGAWVSVFDLRDADPVTLGSWVTAVLFPGSRTWMLIPGSC